MHVCMRLCVLFRMLMAVCRQVICVSEVLVLVCVDLFLCVCVSEIIITAYSQQSVSAVYYIASG